MKDTYEILELESPTGDITKVIHRIEDNAFIPKDESNSDYQRYLRRLENPDAEEGGTR